MSATDILNELKTLPPGEQAAFARLFRQWQSAALSSKSGQKAGAWPDFLARLRRIYGDKISGDSQALISELRGDR
jgi:hypothetical protein